MSLRQKVLAIVLSAGALSFGYVAPVSDAAAPQRVSMHAVPTPSCSRGYYKNGYGHCVHSPSNSPIGATAQCRDGTYSYSQSASGTCSHHGGVRTWINHP